MKKKSLFLLLTLMGLGSTHASEKLASQFKKLSLEETKEAPSEKSDAEIVQEALNKVKSNHKIQDLPDGSILYYKDRPSHENGNVDTADYYRFNTKHNPHTGRVDTWDEGRDAQNKVVHFHPSIVNNKNRKQEIIHFPPLKGELGEGKYKHQHYLNLFGELNGLDILKNKFGFTPDIEDFFNNRKLELQKQIDQEQETLRLGRKKKDTSISNQPTFFTPNVITVNEIEDESSSEDPAEAVTEGVSNSKNNEKKGWSKSKKKRENRKRKEQERKAKEIELNKILDNASKKNSEEEIQNKKLAFDKSVEECKSSLNAIETIEELQREIDKTKQIDDKASLLRQAINEKKEKGFESAEDLEMEEEIQKALGEIYKLVSNAFLKIQNVKNNEMMEKIKKFEKNKLMDKYNSIRNTINQKQQKQQALEQTLQQTLNHVYDTISMLELTIQNVENKNNEMMERYTNKKNTIIDQVTHQKEKFTEMLTSNKDTNRDFDILDQKKELIEKLGEEIKKLYSMLNNTFMTQEQKDQEASILVKLDNDMREELVDFLKRVDERKRH